MNVSAGIRIGIDPGDHTGVAIVRDGVLAECITLPLHRALRVVLDLWEKRRPADPFRVVFEDARQRTWFQRERNVAEYRGKLMGAGAAKRDSRIWEEALTDWGIPFEAHKPTAGGTKWNPAYWQRVTGYTGRTSEHARDAALLVLHFVNQ